MKKPAHEPDQPMNELEALRKSQQINHDLINQLTEQLKAKNTEQQLAEAQLKASEERFRTLVDKAPIGIAMHRNGINLFVNQIYVTMHGYESDTELIGKPVSNLLAPEIRRAIVKRIKNREKGVAEPGMYETVGLRKDGSTFPLFVQSTNILLPDGPANVTFLTDISERKQAEDTLQKAYDELEQKVQERTLQLKQKNEQLQEEKNEQELAETQLKASEERYRLLREQSRIFSWEVDEEGLYTYVDNMCEVIIGYLPEELIGRKHFYDLTPEEERELLKQGVHDAFMRKDQIRNFENEVQTKDGHIVWLSTNGLPILENDGTLRGYRGNNADITDRKLSEEVIKESEAKYRLLTENASDVIWVFNLSKNEFTYVSPAVFFLRGIAQEDAMHQSLEESMTHESFVVVKDAIAKGMDSFLMNPGVPDFNVMEIQQPCKNGDIIWVEVSTKSRLKSEGQIEIIGISRNIEERKKAQAENLYLSYHDQLTGLYNRRFYEDELIRLDTESNLPLTIVMGDVNGLKLINDSFGHAVGDELLKRVADAIGKGCRDGDIIARLGGDEFSIILPQTNEVEAGKVLDCIKDLLSEEKVGSICISISFGYETKNNGNVDIQQIIKKTEDDMYRHKIYESSSMRSKTIDLIMNTLFEKNDREMLHSKRVSEICEAIANKMDFNKDDVNQIRIAGLMHDIGKIGIDEKILNTAQALDDDEWKEIKKHPEVGYRILSSVTEFSEIAGDILAHHERWDGKGYPKGLIGEEIPLRARIIAVADSYDAMTAGRAYRAARSDEETAEEIKRCSGTQFDPEIARVFIEKVLKAEPGCNN